MDIFDWQLLLELVLGFRHNPQSEVDLTEGIQLEDAVDVLKVFLGRVCHEDHAVVAGVEEEVEGGRVVGGRPFLD